MATTTAMVVTSVKTTEATGSLLPWPGTRIIEAASFVAWTHCREQRC